ncbi:hypothetical protein [Caulobacter sp. BP25]|uniref:hypothetical protein n=1 Tax=Caulobacter sp. BP25 TaxID=2048900 RepID=UPI000C12C306|nr:hypothetical protein [Caulobacter sp. BP25]PHY22275.1 hypothetical protein CSW59_02300 [Caulobacter sp. BP25]
MLGALWANSAEAQATTDLAKRLDQIGYHMGRGPSCGEFGFKVHGENVGAMAGEVIADAMGKGFSEDLAVGRLTNARDRGMQEFEQEMEQMTAFDMSDEARFAENTRRGVEKIVKSCRAIAKDPVTRVLVENPSVSDEDLVRELSDEMLAPAGLASWQTPYIRAGGDMIRAVTYCAAYLTRPQSDAYVAELYAPSRFPAGVRNKAVAYFDQLKRRAPRNSGNSRFDATECKGMLARDAEALKAAR